MEELYLNDVLIELQNNSVAVTLQVNDLGELVNRQSSFSNTIDVPKTDNNVSAMDLLGVVGNTSLKPYRKIKAKYVVDGIELISSGSVQIMETSSNFKLRIYDGAVSFFDTIKDKKLSDLGWSLYNHNLNLTNYLASFNNTAGYVYGDGIFFNDEYTSDFNLKSPSIYLHTLFGMIVTQNGFSYEGDIFNETDFKSRVIPIVKGYENNLTFQSPSFLVSKNITKIVNSLSITSIDIQDNFDNVVLTGASIYNIVMNFNITVGGGFVKFYIKKGGEILYSKDFTQASIDTNFIIDLKILGSGTLEFWVDYIGEWDADISRWFVDFSLTGTSNINSTPLNDILIKFEELFEDVKQIDILKDTMQKFGLTFKQVRNSKHLIFKANKDLLIDTINAQDWSDKFSSKESESYDSGYAIENEFKYKYESGVEPFADGTMFIDNEISEQSKTVISSFFTASDKNDIYEVSKNWEIKKVDKVDTRIPKKDAIKTYKVNFLSAPNSVSIEGVKGTQTVVGNTPILSLIDFTSEIINYYKEFKVLLDRYKKVNVKLNLSVLDIYNLDFFKLKYFNQLGKYYYLNKISNFIPDTISNCELIEATDISLLSTVDLIPPTDILSMWITSLSDTSFILNWSDSYDVNGVTYDIYKNDVFVINQVATNYNFTGLTPSTLYNLKIRAKDPSNNYSAFKSISVTTNAIPSDTTPPAQPTGLASSGLTSRSVQLNWTANVEGDLSGYYIYKNGILDKTVYTNSYFYNNTLTPNTAYEFKVSAFDTSLNESTKSSAVNITTLNEVKSFLISSASYPTESEVCDLGTPNVTKYFIGGYSSPQVNDVIYTDSGGATVFNGLNKWYKISSSYSIKINTIGVVTNLFDCTTL